MVDESFQVAAPCALMLNIARRPADNATTAAADAKKVLDHDGKP
ncbi:hypothetical protein [Nocardia tenerifensis]|nr:hypothetical protein [Nocardia tenerifensis]